MGGKVFASVLLAVLAMACLISHAAAEQNTDGTGNLLTVAQPSVIDSKTLQKCCPEVMKPIVLTAKPRYKYVVVPPVTVT